MNDEGRPVAGPRPLDTKNLAHSAAVSAPVQEKRFSSREAALAAVRADVAAVVHCLVLQGHSRPRDWKPVPGSWIATSRPCPANGSGSVASPSGWVATSTSGTRPEPSP